MEFNCKWYWKAKIKLDDFTITNSKKENYLTLFPMIDWSSNITLKACAKRRKRIVSCCSFCWSNLKENFIQCLFQSQFSYCPLVWMCHSRTLNNKINRLYQKCLRLIYNVKTLNISWTFKVDCSVSIYLKTYTFLPHKCIN